jgi:integrase
MQTTTSSTGVQFDELTEAFLDKKMVLSRKGKIKASTVKSYRHRLLLAMEYVGVTTLVNDIGYKELESFVDSCEKSPKTIAESFRCVKELFTWAYHRGDISSLPRFPRYSVSNDDMQLRKTIDKKTQTLVLSQLHKNEWKRAPRKYIACKMLATYVNIRPGELRLVKERDYDRDSGVLTIREHKTSRTTPKTIKLLASDRHLLGSLPKGDAEDYLFRYDHAVSTAPSGAPFGKRSLYRSWKRACKQVGVSGVDLYGGTRHSSAVALYKEQGLSPEQIRRATGTRTSKAFMRYLPLDLEDVAEIHSLAEPGR